MKKSYDKAQLVKFIRYINLFNLFLGGVCIYLFYFVNGGTKELALDFPALMIWFIAMTLYTLKVVTSPKNKGMRLEGAGLMFSIALSIALIYIILPQIEL